MFKIDPEGWYPEDQLRLFGIDGDLLRVAVESGQLKVSHLGRSRLYRGRWLIDWLESLARPEGRQD